MSKESIEFEEIILPLCLSDLEIVWILIKLLANYPSYGRGYGFILNVYLSRLIR